MSKFVISKSNNLGVGKLCGGLDEITVRIKYFYSVNDQREEVVPRDSVSRVDISRQTRCYVLSKDGIWQIGRIGQKDDSDNTYEVDFPNGFSRYIPETDIFVRCNDVKYDPIDVLSSKAHETPFFHEKRHNFVKSLVRQRAISGGLTGLLSSKIQLFPHQMEVTRRVLEDPVQRYLLADEVGLGKTIEAGIILRQFLIDESRSKALVFVPTPLVWQWKNELEDKFRVSEFGNRVFVAPTEELERINDNWDLSSIGFLIIDEAHHVAAGGFSRDSNQKLRYNCCERLTKEIDRVLLLSATPALNNEGDFLAMLHLLDPTTFHLEDLDSFYEIVRKRQDLGHILLSFNEGASGFIIKRTLKKFRDVYPDDDHLTLLVDDLEKVVQDETKGEERDSLIRLIRIHITDTYRLYRRMLRTRRSSTGLTPRMTTEQFATHLKEEYDDDLRGEQLHETLDEWRLIAEKNDEYKSIFLSLFQASGTWIKVLESLIKLRLNLQSDLELEIDFSVDDLNLFKTTNYFNGEKPLLENMLDIIEEEGDHYDRIQLLIDMLQMIRRIQQKVVVFTGYEVVQEELLSRIKEKFGNKAVRGHDRQSNSRELEDAIEKFKTDDDCFILVSDTSGEEGRNLQFVDWIVHFDTPLSPNQLEQRIGRLDRIGREDGVKTRTLLGCDLPNSMHEAWYRLLKEGFGIYEKSVASLQFYIDKRLPELTGILFEEGQVGLLDQIPETQEQIKEELIKIDEQHSLDEIDLLESDTERFISKLSTYESDSRSLRQAYNLWLCGGLNLNRVNRSTNGAIFSYNGSRDTLIPTDILIDKFGSYIDQREPIFGTFERNVAVKNKNVVLHRLGESFTNRMLDYVNWDDRGRAFAIWRKTEQWNDLPLLVFRFDYIVETNLHGISEFLMNDKYKTLNLSSLQRRADGLFPPIVETVFVDSLGELITDQTVLEILRKPYNKKGLGYRDKNLGGKRLHLIDLFFDSDSWEKAVTNARKQSERLLTNDQSFQSRCSAFSDQAKKKLTKRTDTIRIRAEREARVKTNAGESYFKELEFENILRERLVAGIRKPYLRLDSAGFYVLSNEDPPERNDG